MSEGGEESSEFSGRVLANYRITLPDAVEELRYLEFEVQGGPAFEPGQHIAVHLPRPFHEDDRPPRLYTISGAESDSGRGRVRLQICVRRALQSDSPGNPGRFGLTSSYLCDLAVGDRVRMNGPIGSPFRIPADHGTTLVMIGMGTGIAPFRYFARYLYDTFGGWEGQVRMFYGDTTGLESVYLNDRHRDFAHYYDEKTYRSLGALHLQNHFDTEPAGSGDDLMNRRRELGEHLGSPETYFYLAGLREIRDRLDKILVPLAGSARAWKERRERMTREDRWSELIY